MTFTFRRVRRQRHLVFVNVTHPDRLGCELTHTRPQFSPSHPLRVQRRARAHNGQTLVINVRFNDNFLAADLDLINPGPKLTSDQETLITEIKRALTAFDVVLSNITLASLSHRTSI